MRTPTIRRYEKLAAAARDVVIVPPTKRHPQRHNAMVPWDTIVALRHVLDDAGIDWRTAKKQHEAERNSR